MFLRCESLDFDRIYIHGIGINLGVLCGLVSLGWVWVVWPLVCYSISSVPLGFETDGSSVLVINFGGDSIHAKDSFHEWSRYSS